jgi:hypothetical protein
MKRGGRPTKFKPELVQMVLRCLEKGMPLKLTCDACGISHQTLITYRQKHPKFADAMLGAIAKGVEKRLEKIQTASDAGDWRAAAWLLEHCQPEHFAKTRIQIEAVGQFDHALVIPQETLDQIAESRAKHEQELNGNGKSPIELPEARLTEKTPV